MRKCNHNPNSKENTFKQLSLQVMTCPRVYYAQCSVCGELFEYIETTNGRYKMVTSVKSFKKEEDQDADIGRDTQQTK